MGRAPCCDKANVKRGPWSPDEDTVLKNYVERHGTGGNWISLPHKAGIKRCGKSCRLRWLNYLRPDIKHGGFTEEEDNAIYTLYKNIGSRWSVIASRLPGRTDNDVKNYWNTKLKKKLLAEKTNSSNNIVKNNYVKLSYSYSSSPFGGGIKTESSNYSLSGFSSSNSHEESSAMPLMEAESGYNVVLQRFSSEPISFPASGFLDNTDLSLTANGYCRVSPSQEVSATSLPLDTSYISWSDNGGGGDDSSSFLGDFSNGPSFDLLNGYDFQDNMPDPTLHYAPNYNYLLANSKSSQFRSLTY